MPPYLPQSKCIYCGSAAPRGEEHIIPLCIGGKLVIPDASCRKCERTTSRVEDACFKAMFDASRPHIGLKGRNQKRIPNRTSVTIQQSEISLRKKVALHEHPGMLLMFGIDRPPGLLLGRNSGTGTMAFAVAISVVPDVAERARRLGGKIQLLKRPFRVETFFQMSMATASPGRTKARRRFSMLRSLPCCQNENRRGTKRDANWRQIGGKSNFGANRESAK
jgi:hypothetical protein